MIEANYQPISDGKERLSDIQIQHRKEVQETEQIRQKGEAIRQEVSELSETSDLLKEQATTLAEDKKKLLSDNVKLEKQQKKLQQDIEKMVQSKAVMERNIHAYDEDEKWQLPETAALMSAKAYKDKKAFPLVEKLKETIKALTIKCVQIAEQGQKLKEKVTRQEQQISRLTDKVMEQSDIIDRLQEKTADLGRLERYFGREQVQSIVERSKALEWAEKENKRPKRVFDMSRWGIDRMTDMEKKVMVRLCAKIFSETDLYDTDMEVRNLIDWICVSEQIKSNNNEIRSITGEYKRIEPDCREGVRTQLEHIKSLCKERESLYEKQNDLKGQKQKIERALER